MSHQQKEHSLFHVTQIFIDYACNPRQAPLSLALVIWKMEVTMGGRVEVNTEQERLLIAQQSFINLTPIY